MDRSTDKNTEKRKENKKTYRGRLDMYPESWTHIYELG